MRASVAIILAFALASPAVGHDFWIQPDRYAVEVGDGVPFTLRVGHGTAQQRWGVPASRIRRFAAISATGSTDLRAGLHTETGVDDGSLVFKTAGTHVVVLESSSAFSSLPADKFNEYLAVEGLTPAIAQRKAGGTTATDGREFYSRRAKTLIRVGNTDAAQPHVTKPTQLTLEIVPLENPYGLKAGEALPLQILFEGRPLPGAAVKLNNLESDAEPVAQRVSDARGRVAFDVPLRGRWQINVVWTQPIKSSGADFQTTFSSLSFGF